MIKSHDFDDKYIQLTEKFQRLKTKYYGSFVYKRNVTILVKTLTNWDVNFFSSECDIRVGSDFRLIDKSF